jgi:hypothetical protein
VRVRALEEVELHRVVGLTVFRQVEAEPLKLGALVGEKAVEGVVEHRRYQLPHDQNSMVVWNRASPPQLVQPSGGSDSLDRQRASRQRAQGAVLEAYSPRCRVANRPPS